jgi:hypothetical protein
LSTAAVVAAPRRHGLASEAGRLRRDAQARYTEVDLLVVTLRDHVRDLQLERDRLLDEIARLRDTSRREAAAWMWRGQRPQAGAAR